MSTWECGNYVRWDPWGKPTSVRKWRLRWDLKRAHAVSVYTCLFIYYRPCKPCIDFLYPILIKHHGVYSGFLSFHIYQSFPYLQILLGYGENWLSYPTYSISPVPLSPPTPSPLFLAPNTPFPASLLPLSTRLMGPLHYQRYLHGHIHISYQE